MKLNRIKISEDLFTKTKEIDWEFVAGRVPRDCGFDFEDAIVTGTNNDNFSKLIFSPVNKDENNYLKFRFQKKFFNPKKVDSVAFLFENDRIEIFVIDANPIEIMDHSNWGRILEVYTPISLDQLDTFANIKFFTWKFKSGNKKLLFKDGIAGDNFRPKETLQKVICQLFKESIHVILSEELYTENNNIKSTDESCYVYLMRDLVNGSYKIGISNSPKYREKTLQSEKPEIKLMHSKQFHKRSIAEIFEKVLHEFFKNKRIRGEWFQLTDEDISYLKTILK